DTPTPAAGPFTAPTTGRGKARIAATVRLAASIVSAEGGVLRSRPERSAPEQNARPAPVSTATRTEASSAYFSKASAIASSVSVFTAFIRAGRFRVTRRTPSSTVASTPGRSSVMAVLLGSGRQVERDLAGRGTVLERPQCRRN